jgi:hypothetical protein
MNIISPIDHHGALKRWAIGEVNSQFFCRCYGYDPEFRQQTLALLKSGDPIKEAEGIRRHYKTRASFIGSIPADTEWFLASFHVIDNEFQGLRTIRDPGWEKHSGGSYLLCEAAENLIANPCEDPRLFPIILGLPDGNVNLTGITLWSMTKEGPYIIAEGTARLVAIYYHCIHRGIELFENNAIEVVVGVSRTKWRPWSPI